MTIPTDPVPKRLHTPTDDDIPERHRRLVEELISAGALSSPRWIHAFATTPRHLFVPAFRRPVQDVAGFRQELVDRDRPEDWLDAVYADTTLATVLRDGEAGPLVSSATVPSLMAQMLEALEVEPGQKILEIGTGTGYNAALLATVVGDANVSTVECEPDVAAAARRHLAQAGHPGVRVFTGDATDPEVISGGGPYDRVIATCALRSIPRAWLGRTTPGGLIIVPVGTGLARLTVTGPDSATGRFLAHPAYFMAARHGTETRALRPPDPTRPARRTDVALRTWYDNDLRFLLALALPGVLAAGPSGPDPRELVLWHADGSVVHVTSAGDVREGGPRALWGILERTVETWTTLGRPAREMFGITVTPDRQWIWHERPDGDRTWDLDR